MPSIMFKLISCWLILINLCALILTIADKRKAIKGQWRIKESTLLLFAFLGGGIGEFIAMLTVRHKTRHAKFMLCVPLSIIIWAVLLYFTGYFSLK